MKEQDRLWELEGKNNNVKVDLKLMEKLQNQIVQEAQRKGFKGATITYIVEGEVITEIYKSKADLLEEQEKGGDLYVNITSKCKSLIETLEKMLNN